MLLPPPLLLCYCRMRVGTKVDMGKAKQWAAKAAGQGSQRAADLLKTLDNQMDSKQWSKMMGQMKKGVPEGATGAEAAGALVGCRQRYHIAQCAAAECRACLLMRLSDRQGICMKMPYGAG
jgi:hypothetical protein